MFHHLGHDTMYTAEHPGWNWQSWGTHDAEGSAEKILMEYLEINMRILDDNTKMDVKETSLYRHNSSLLHREKLYFQKRYWGYFA